MLSGNLSHDIAGVKGLSSFLFVFSMISLYSSPSGSMKSVALFTSLPDGSCGDVEDETLPELTNFWNDKNTKFVRVANNILPIRDF